MNTVNNYQENKRSNWWVKSVVRHHFTYRDLWDTTYYASREDAVIAMLMSYALCCRNNYKEMVSFLQDSTIAKYCIAMEIWTEEILIELVEHACFMQVKLQPNTLMVALVLLLLPGDTTVKEIMILTGLTKDIVIRCLRTLENKDIITSSFLSSVVISLTKKVTPNCKVFSLVGNSKVIYYLKLQLAKNPTLAVQLYSVLVKNGVFSTLQLDTCEVVIDDTAKVVLLKSHPHFYPWIKTPARQKIFCKDTTAQQEKIFSTPKKKGLQHVMVTKPLPATTTLEIVGPLEYDLAAFLIDHFDAPEYIRDGFETVKICCPDITHEDTNPSCTVFAAGNAYCHSCGAKFKDIREIAATVVDENFYTSYATEYEEAIADLLHPFVLHDGLISQDTVEYQKAAQRRYGPRGVPQYELDAMRERYDGVYKYGDSHYGKNWQDISYFSPAQYDLFSAGYAQKTLEDFHVYTFALDPWYKIRVPLVANGVVVGEQAISTNQDRARGAGKYYTSPGLEKQKHVYGLLDTRESACMVVEGVKDMWRVYQRGFTNVCTMLGSTMSDEQADYLSKHFSTVFLAYDNDKAGRTGYIQAYNKLVSRGVKVQQVVYAAKDPDLCPISEWRSAVIKACSNAGYFTPSAVWDYGV